MLLSLIEPQIIKILELGVQYLPRRSILRRNGDPYLDRYYILGRKPFGFDDSLKPVWGFLPFTVFLHHFRSSDEAIELHNHPWDASASLILAGGYTEERLVQHLMAITKVERELKAGDINFIKADDYHRVELQPGKDAWTLFITGNKTQTWGFLHPTTRKYTHWKDYVAGN